jgi:PilZ domain
VRGAKEMELSKLNSMQCVRLRICGVDVNGKACTQSVTAHDLNYSGARLDGLTYAISPGTKVGLQCEDLVVAAQVVWLAVGGADGRCRAGVRLLDPKRCPWKNVLPNEDRTLRFPQRRSADRYRMAVAIQILDAEENLMQTITSDVGIGGCYVETASPLEVGTRIEVLLTLGAEDLQTDGIVRVTYPGVGMGIEFLGLSWEQTARLYQFLELNLRLT